MNLVMKWQFTKYQQLSWSRANSLLKIFKRKCMTVTLIMFLFKELTSVETLYWPIELETAALVFMIKKSRHLVEANDFLTIIYTDYVAVRYIAHFTSLKTSSLERANMWLIRGSQYLSQFQLNVCYRSGKDNIAADVLSKIKQIQIRVDIFTVITDVISDQNWSEHTIYYLNIF